MTVDETVGAFMAWAARVISGTSERWVGCEPSTRQRVYFANHSSHLDILIIWACLPVDVRRVTRPLAARDYWTTSALRRYLVSRVFNAIVIDRVRPDSSFREAYESIRAVVDGMGQAHSVILFPEGTRGSGDEIGPFKGGLYMIAREHPSAELVPVYMENLNRILPKGEMFPVPLISSISFGPPIRLEDRENKHSFLDRARNALLRLGQTG